MNMEFSKFFRYLFSGYLFERKSILRSLQRPNGFEESTKTYDLPRIAVYTVSTGGYDGLREPAFIDSNIDYFAFTNSELPKDSVWKSINIGDFANGRTPLEQARYVKTHPHLYFSDYEISIFIDGNICIIKDIKPLIYKMIETHKTVAIHRHNCRNCLYQEARIIWAQGRAKLRDIIRQIKAYKGEGFPAEYGLFETNVIIRYHNDEKCKAIMETWWSQIDKYTKRDQLSFTYSLWKNDVTSDYVMSLGFCSRNSPYFDVVGHKK